MLRINDTLSRIKLLWKNPGRTAKVSAVHRAAHGSPEGIAASIALLSTKNDVDLLVGRKVSLRGSL